MRKLQHNINNEYTNLCILLITAKQSASMLEVGLLYKFTRLSYYLKIFVGTLAEKYLDIIPALDTNVKTRRNVLNITRVFLLDV